MNLFEYLENSNKKIIYHVTAPYMADNIKANGFDPKNTINYKYYSPMGKDGLYFYDDMRLVQQYAYHLKSKLKLDYVVLIRCGIDPAYLQYNNTIEDGFFVPKEAFDKIKIINFQDVKKINALY